MAAVATVALVGCGGSHVRTVVRTVTERRTAVAGGRPTPSTTRAAPAVLGINVENLDSSRECSAPFRQPPIPCRILQSGVLIDQVDPGGPAAKAGLVGGKVQSYVPGAPVYYVGGDVIVSLDGHSIPDTDVLLSEMAQYTPGEVVQVGVMHTNGTEATIRVTLGAGPSASPSATSSTPAGGRCGRVYISALHRQAKVRVVDGDVSCTAARQVIAAAYQAESTRRWDGSDPTNGVFWRTLGWQCFIGLAGSQTFCHRGSSEVDGSTRAGDGWTF